METYGQDQHELDLLRELVRGEAEIRAGVGHSLDEVLADVDALLAPPSEEAD